jgi:cytochrome c-type biogenesis protein CcmH/NrfG
MGLARVYARQGKLDEAESQLMRAVDLDPAAIQAAPGTGPILRRPKGDVDQAQAQIEKAIQLNPGNSDLYIILGNFFFQMKKPAEAESAYLKAIDISPKEIKPYMVAAGFYDASKQRGQDACHVREGAGGQAGMT